MLQNCYAKHNYFISWKPERHLHCSKVLHWKPEGHYHCRKSMASAPFWFSTEHRRTALTPFWLSVNSCTKQSYHQCTACNTTEIMLLHQKQKEIYRIFATCKFSNTIQFYTSYVFFLFSFWSLFISFLVHVCVYIHVCQTSSAVLK